MSVEREPTDAFKVLNAFFGWGEPSKENSRTGTLWFIGVEEASSWSTEEEIRNHYGRYAETGFKPPESEGSDSFDGGNPIRVVTSKIACSLSKSVSDKYGSPIDKAGFFHWENEERIWKEYRDNHLWKPDSNLFQANLFPIGKPESNYWQSEDYKRLYGFTNKKDYVEYVKENRFKELRAFHKKHEPQASVCFGKGHWKYFEHALELADIEFTRDYGENILAYKDARVVLTRHFSNGCPNSVVKGIINLLVDWGVHLP